MPGLLLSGTVGVVPALGIGAEASAVRVTKSPLTTFGVFGQAQSYAGEYGRYAGGVEMGWGFGAELGYDFREAHNEFAGTHGVHVAAFASLGFASLALRSTVPVAKGNSLGRNQGFEMGLALTIKIPVGNYSEDLPFSIGHGRPPRRGQTAFRGRSGGYAAQLWQERATHELASVATFVALAHDLAMHGAPLALTARALHAAQDEWAHAMGAARVAAAMGGNATFQASSFAQTGASVDVLVREAVTDGMVGEGAAAHALWAAAEDHGAGALRDELARVGGQERRHATLAHDVVGTSHVPPRGPRCGGPTGPCASRPRAANKPHRAPLACVTERRAQRRPPPLGPRRTGRTTGNGPGRARTACALPPHLKHEAERAVRLPNLDAGAGERCAP
jgi:hypothetical protein